MVAVATPCQLPAALLPVAQRVVRALQQEAEHYTAVGATPKIELEKLCFEQVVDPSNQGHGYQATWRNARNARCGTLTFNSDHSFYAEYDLFCPHPRDARWFVEMVTAWGCGENLRSEVKLIPNL